MLSRTLYDTRFDLRQIPDPSPPPIKEPPDGPENPDVPVREPDPVEPSEIERCGGGGRPPPSWSLRNIRRVLPHICIVPGSRNSSLSSIRRPRRNDPIH